MDQHQPRTTSGTAARSDDSRRVFRKQDKGEKVNSEEREKSRACWHAGLIVTLPATVMLRSALSQTGTGCPGKGYLNQGLTFAGEWLWHWRLTRGNPTALWTPFP